MQRQEKISKIIEYFSQVKNEIELNISIHYYDINRACENAFIPILKIIFQAPQLKNLSTGENFAPRKMSRNSLGRARSDIWSGRAFLKNA